VLYKNKEFLQEQDLLPSSGGVVIIHNFKNRLFHFKEIHQVFVLLSWQWFLYHDNGIIWLLWKNRHVTITMEQNFQAPIFREMITTCQSTRIYAFERNNYKLIWEKCINYYNNFDFGIFTILFLEICRTINSLKFLAAS